MARGEVGSGLRGARPVWADDVGHDQRHVALGRDVLEFRKCADEEAGVCEEG